MPSEPQNRTPHQFQCRDYLWEAFEQMSQEYDCSVDYLINESMRLYAHSRGRGGPYAETPEPVEPRNAAPQYRPGPPGMQGGMPGGMPGMPGMQGRPPMPMAQPGMPRTNTAPPMNAPGGAPGMARPGGLPPMTPPPPQPGGPRLPPMAPPGANPGQFQGMQPPGRPPGGMPGMPTGAPRPPGGMPGMPSPMPPAPGPGGMPQMRPTGPAGGPAGPPARAPGRAGGTLVAIYEGQQYPVTKEEFVIGRGQKTSDLTIRDSNVSRRHACVVLYNGQYWMVDQQSTNGVEFNGTKVDRKPIEHGDMYRICDHDIQFVYR